MDLNGKKALITGGSEGIGLGIAQAFLENGAKVAITGRTKEKLLKAQEELEVAIEIYVADSLVTNDSYNTYQSYCQDHTKLDILVVNAGISFQTKLGETTEEDFDKMIATNLKGVFFSVQNALPFLNPGASIILISSVAAKIGPPNFAVYSATKAGVTSFAQSFGSELANLKIRVNSISPGFIDTPILDKIGIGQEEKEDWKKYVPLKRWGKPVDIANMAVFLASDRANYITATDFVVDGGLLGAKIWN